MEDVMLKDILEKHRLWLLGDKNGVKANLREVNLSEANLSYANLREVDLSYANLIKANLRDVDLSYANLIKANLREAGLREAYLREADLREANLNYADLSYADLREANLSYADLRGVNLSYADLRGANLRGANLDYSCLPLWCGSLSAHFDDRQLKQLAYHLVRAGLQSKNASDETKRELVKLIDFANGFHRVGECGKIRVGCIEDLKGVLKNG